MVFLIFSLLFVSCTLQIIYDSNTEIISFYFSDIEGQVTISPGSITVIVPKGTDCSSLTPHITLSSVRASVSPASGVAQDFRTPVLYTVTTEDRTVRVYTVAVIVQRWIPATTNAEFTPRDGAGALSFQGKLWLLGGWRSDGENFDERTCSEVWVSNDDGKTWEKGLDAPWGARHCAGWVVFENRMWVISGDGHADVWSSSDGVNWNQAANDAPWGKRYSPIVSVFKEKIWLMGGLSFWHEEDGTYGLFTRALNDVWSSSDGVTWNKELEAAPWSPRGLFHGSAVLNDTLFIIGGGIKGTVSELLYSETIAEYNDVWKTEDGISWVRVRSSSPWRPRTHFSVTTYNDQIYITDGSITTQANLSNEVWRSSDGINWIDEQAIPWPPRHASSLVTHNGKLFIIGGYLHNDVWYME